MTYPALTISAIDHTSGILTITGHGLVTGGGFTTGALAGFGTLGNGPSWGGAIYAAPGSGGVIPAGLSPATTYWPIRLDDDHIKLASSNANAMAGIAVSFSDNGTLPLSFLVGIPYELPRMSAPGQMVFSDDLVTSWQALKALWQLTTAQAQSIWASVALAVPLILKAALRLVSSSGKAISHVAPAGLVADYTVTWPAAPPTTKGSVYLDSTGALSTGETRNYSAALAAPASTSSSPTFSSSPPFYNIGATAVAVVCPIFAPVGARITALQAFVEKTSNATFTVQAVLHDTNTATFTRLTTPIGSNNANNPGAVSVGATGLSIDVQAGHIYELHVNESTGLPGSGLDGVVGWSVTW